MSLLEKAENDTGRQWEYTQEGDAVEGVLTGYSIFDGGEYEPAPMISIDATTIIEGGEKSKPETLRILCGKMVLKRKVEEANLQVGDTVAIFYKGEKPRKNDASKTYSDFGLAVERSSLVQAAAADAGKDW
jgi:hypothetical protein